VKKLEVEVKGIDEQGRIILPKNWREKYLKNKKAIISAKGDTIEIKPLTSIDLTEYFDKINVDVKADLSDWHKVRKELRGK
jgi:bifunctional DNA-binding transcriptional regulator/antitoxin component of YhaV-PrlF toxin-antitoxin module